MSSKAGRHNNMTSGVIWKQLALFSLPLLGSSLIQQLYNTVDLIFIGRVLGKEASAAVGASSLLVTCLIGFFTGMSVGSSVISARFFGANDKAGVKTTLHTAMAIGLIGGAAITVLGIAFAPVFLRWMNTPEDIMGQAVDYIRVYFFSVIPMVGYNFGSGVIRALGDSRSPMVYQLIGGLFNVAVKAVFLSRFSLGITGFAATTCLAQTIAFALVLRHLRRLDMAYRLEYAQIRTNTAVMRSIFAVGVPAGVQATITTLSSLFVQYNINSLGVDNIAAFTAYFKVELFLYLPIMAFSQAISTFSSQNTGAGQLDRVKHGTRVCIVMGVGLTVILSASLLILIRPAYSLFVMDEAVIDIGVSISRITFPLYFLYVFLEAYSSTIRGAGKSLPPMVFIVSNMCVLRAILLFIFMDVFHTTEAVATVYPITWFSASVCLGVYYYKGNWAGMSNEVLVEQYNTERM